MVTSMRSSSGPLRRRWWRARSAAEQRQRWSPRPHGHGFDAATSMQRVGNSITRCERTIATRPSSSGWRSASSAERANSDSSSRNSTPWWASVISPGNGTVPPPTRPGGEIVWCGARNGRVSTRPPPECRPAIEWMRVTSIASARVSGGRIDGTRRAIIVLPVPGGPCRNRLWPPAAATRIAGSSASCPRTSLMSGGSRAAALVRLRRRLGERRHRGAAGEDVRHLVQRARRRRPRSPRRAPPPAPGPPAPRSARGRARGCPARSPARPRIGRTSPVSDSSPANTQPSTCSRSTWLLAARMAIATGRSKPGPILRRYAGARLIVMRFCGNSKPEFVIADRTRSRASRTALSASPTIVKAGRPTRMSASTQTRRESTPSSAKAVTRARLIRTLPGGGRG